MGLKWTIIVPAHSNNKGLPSIYGKKGGDGPQTIVLDGSPVTGGAVLVASGLEAGSHTLNLNWTADATLENTKVGTYSTTVTFTVADVT